jgi:hypothetical protein
VARQHRPSRRYADLADRFRAAPDQLSNQEVAELLTYAREAPNYRLERQCVEALSRGHVVLDHAQARVVGAVLEVARDDRFYDTVRRASSRVGRSEVEALCVIDAVVETIQAVT